jgi:hypothetical protein
MIQEHRCNPVTEFQVCLPYIATREIERHTFDYASSHPVTTCNSCRIKATAGLMFFMGCRHKARQFACLKMKKAPGLSPGAFVYVSLKIKSNVNSPGIAHPSSKSAAFYKMRSISCDGLSFLCATNIVELRFFSYSRSKLLHATCNRRVEFRLPRLKCILFERIISMVRCESSHLRTTDASTV